MDDEEERIETWPAIAARIGRSREWCWYTSKKKDDPLPVYKIGGIVAIDVKDLNAWLERQKKKTKRGRR